MAVSTDWIAPCNEPSPQPYSPSSVDTFTNSQLHQLIQYLNVSIFVICIEHPFYNWEVILSQALAESIHEIHAMAVVLYSSVLHKKEFGPMSTRTTGLPR